MRRFMLKHRVAETFFISSACLILIALLGAAAFYRWYYPYGHNHCCDKSIALNLMAYAEEHGGFFPDGAETPEASFSLLYPRYENAYNLRGKRIPLEVAEPILERGAPLTADTCDWGYVSGLKSSDNHEIMICWDKSGLGHSGERQSGGGHSIILIGGMTDYIPGPDWVLFLEKQKRLLDQLRGAGRRIRASDPALN